MVRGLMSLLVLTGFVVTGSVFTSAVAADEGRCKSEVVSATGKPSRIGELARANAFFTWKAVARQKFGKDYMAWSYATERKLVCVDLMSGENKGKWECTRTARPCIGLAAATPAAKTCKEVVTNAYGARRGTVAAAKIQAKSGWVAKVTESFDESWADWEAADKTSYDCRRKNAYQYQCIAQGYACQK